MDISRQFINNPVRVWLTILLLGIGGIFALLNIGRLEDPAFTIKTAVVVTHYPGASAQQVEEEVTLPLENALQQLPYLDNVSSISSNGLSQITVNIASRYHSNELPQIWDELRRRVRIDCIAVAPQEPHSAGYPMSQRLKSGFNWPPLSIPAEQPVRICPEAVKRAGPVMAAAWAKSCGDPFLWISDSAPSTVLTFFSPSAAREVGHPASWSILDRALPSGFTASSAMPGESFQSRALAVAHPASGACCTSETPVMFGVITPPRLESDAEAVAHPASVTRSFRFAMP